ncbi:MAG: hypothetical protein JWP09_332 [Candidatus Taylorbacteria bacterium]|nr:hypothetical protein [Candidatus Taylorbacteria bacterium]
MKIKYVHPAWADLMQLVREKKISKNEVQESGCIRIINPGDFIDKAISRFATCHQHVREGNKIVMRNEYSEQMVHLPILESWTKDEVRKDASMIEIDMGITEANNRTLTQLLSNKAAPNLELLLATAISFYCQVISYLNNGYSLMSESKNQYIFIE